MGFSSSLQSQAAHEALLNRQDSELRLLDTMRKSLQLKVKCDREYASSLISAVSQGQKIDGSEDLLGSGVTQAWKSIMEGFEFVAKLIRQNADSIENKVLDKLNQLFLDKRKAKKFYQDEYNRVTSQFSKVGFF